MSAEETVQCPNCGRNVLASAMENHNKFFCPKRPAVSESEVNKPAAGPDQPVVDAIVPPQTVDSVISELENASKSAASPKPEEASPAAASPTAPVPDTTRRHIFQSGESLPVPPAESNFWISQKHAAVLERASTLSQQGQIINLLIMGHTGCGKTTLARHFAARYGRPFYEVHCGALMDVEQWFGKDRLINGETLYRKSRFVQAVETPWCVVLLDEINRAHPEQLNGIFGLLDWRRSIYSDDLGYQIRVAEGVVFFATMNEGVDYYGVNPLDNALRDRFPRILRLSYPPVEAEEKLLVEAGADMETAGNLAKFAKYLRDATMPIPVSPRQLQTAVEEIGLGATLREAIELSIINKLDDEGMEKQALEALQLIDPNPYVEAESGQESDPNGGNW